MQIIFFRKFDVKYLNNYFFENISNFLVEDGKTRYANYFSTVNNGGFVFFLLALQTDRQTDGRTYTFFEISSSY